MRPFESHSSQGAQAWLDGHGDGANPYEEDSLAWAEWLIGYLDLMADSGDLDELDEDCARMRLDEVRGHARRLVASLRLELPSAGRIADAIGMDVPDWRGNCYAVSVAALQCGLLDEFQEAHGRLFPSYGIYDGPVIGSGPGPRRHGWLESMEGHVVDPTRWVFTGENPSLWVGPLDDYDLAGARLRTRFRPSKPPDEQGPLLSLGVNDPETLAAFDRVLGDTRTSITGRIAVNRLAWLVNSPLERLGRDAPMFIRVADRLGRGAMVPIDVRRWLDNVAEDDQPGRRASHAR